jgi:hypothetical protein
VGRGAVEPLAGTLHDAGLEPVGELADAITYCVTPQSHILA